jgi:hypothetical protein
MRNTRLIVGRTAVGILVLAAGTGVARSRTLEAITGADMSVRTVATELAGEWDGQLQVRGTDGSLSTSLVSMSARLAADGQRLELYYEGFAFGKAVEGAMVLSFGEHADAVAIRDGATGLHAICAPKGEDSGPGSALAMLGFAADGSREVRTVFSRADDHTWSIDYQAKGKSGEWSSIMIMNMGRLGGEKRSPAASNFEKSPDLEALRKRGSLA